MILLEIFFQNTSQLRLFTTQYVKGKQQRSNFRSGDYIIITKEQLATLVKKVLVTVISVFIN